MTRAMRFGIACSALVHGMLLAAVLSVHQPSQTEQQPSVIAFTVSPPPPPPPPPPKAVKKMKKPVKRPPVSHIRKKKTPPKKPVKPVFGVTQKSVLKTPTPDAPAVRVGNTLMKKQEKEFTPPEQVKDYAAGERLEERKNKAAVFSPVPLIEIGTMPKPISPVKPEYPEELKEDEVEGEVIVKLSINKQGKVVKVAIISSDNPLFTASVKKTVKKYRFIPGKDKKGHPVDVEIEMPIIFELDF